MLLPMRTRERAQREQSEGLPHRRVEVLIAGGHRVQDHHRQVERHEGDVAQQIPQLSRSPPGPFEDQVEHHVHGGQTGERADRKP